VDPSRVRRVQALLCTGPVHELQASRSQRGGIWSALDCYDLVLEALDTVVDKMGFDVGCDQDELERHLGDHITTLISEASDDDATDVAHTIVEQLIRPRQGVYTDDRRRQFDFALLREHPGVEGAYLVATNEAINVLIGALDTDVASAQAAAEAQLHNLLRRNRLAEAARVARDARVRSIQYGQEVRRVIADTRRDIRRAGWSGSVPERMREILTHLLERLELEERMIASLREHRDDAGRADLAEQASQLIATVGDCMNRHRELHNLVLQADEAFYEEQHRQAFRPSVHLRGVDLIDEIVGPVLVASLRDALPITSAFCEASWGTAPPRLPRLDSLLRMLLADTREIDRDGAPLPDDPLDEDHDPRRFSELAHETAGSILESCQEVPRRLSTLLGDPRAQDPAVADLVVLRCLAAFDPELGRPKPGQMILAAADDGATFAGEDWEGSDLLVGSLGIDAVRLASNPPKERSG
jgi:hypothetical protein